MRQNKRLCFLLVYLLVGGCTVPTSSPRLAPQSATTTSFTVTTAVPTTTLIKIAIEPLNSPTASLTPTSAPPTSTPYPPETKLVSNCLEVLPSLPDEAKVTGKIVLMSESIDNQEVFLKEIETGEMIRISSKDENFGSIVIAPNRRLLAIMTTEGFWGPPKNLVLMNGNGERVKVLPWDESWFNLQAITDEHRLLISNNNGRIEDYPYSLAVVDPFTNQQMLIDPVFPDYLKDANIPYWEGWYGVIYDSSASFAIYPMAIQEEGDKLYTFSLWSVPNNQLVGSFDEIFKDALFSSGGAPMLRWSSDNSMFGLPANSAGGELGEFDLYKIRTDGQVERLTYLSSVAHMRGLPFSWSPDDQKIAMLLDLRPGVGESHLAVLNVQSGVVTDYCVTRGYPSEDVPIWSPDGSQLLLYDVDSENESSSENGPLQSRVVLVDIVEGFAAVIANGMVPVGWLASDE